MRIEETAYYQDAIQWISHSVDDFGDLVEAAGWLAPRGKRPYSPHAMLWGIPVIFKDWCPKGEILVVKAMADGK